MGKRGPKPKHPKLKELEGNPGQRRIEKALVKAEGGVFIPDHIRDDAKGCVELIKQSMPDEIYRGADSFALASYGMAWAMHKYATEQLESTDQWYITTQSGAQQPSVWIKIINEQARVMMSLGDRLGLDPKSRATLHLAEESKPGTKSKFDGLIGRKPSSPSLNA